MSVLPRASNLTPTSSRSFHTWGRRIRNSEVYRHRYNVVSNRTVVRFFSNQPFGVKHLQTIHHCGVDVARGLALLFGIRTSPLPSWGSKTRRNNLNGGLAVRRTAGPPASPLRPKRYTAIATAAQLQAQSV